MKRTILAFLCIACFSSVALAQTKKASADSSFLEIGINTIALLRTFPQADSPIPSLINPFQLTADASFGNLGIRLGAGYQAQRSSELPSQTANSNTEFTRDTVQSHFRIGFGYYKNLTSKWSLRAGIDARFHNYEASSNSFFVTETGEDVNTTNITTIRQRGVSPFFFLQYHIGPRVSLATELTFLLSTSTFTENIESDLTEFSSTLIKEETFNRLEAPTALYLIVRF